MNKESTIDFPKEENKLNEKLDKLVSAVEKQTEALMLIAQIIRNK
jgi:hypothetical protein